MNNRSGGLCSMSWPVCIRKYQKSFQCIPSHVFLLKRQRTALATPTPPLPTFWIIRLFSSICLHRIGSQCLILGCSHGKPSVLTFEITPSLEVSFVTLLSRPVHAIVSRSSLPFSHPFSLLVCFRFVFFGGGQGNVQLPTSKDGRRHLISNSS